MRPKGSRDGVLSWAYHRREDSATILKDLMSTQANTIRLDADVIAALREAAEREHKSLDQMAGEAIMRGLSADRDAEWRELIAFGHEQGNKSGIREEDVPELVRDWRRDYRQSSR
jgi:predicted transcriptional regulator